MSNQELVKKLEKIGKLPAAKVCDETNFPLKEFDALLRKFTLPIDFDTAVSLIGLSPPVGEGCHGVEWTLIHIVETTDAKQFREVLDNSSDGAVKRMLEIRLNNFAQKEISAK